jgi:hypothetical protein
MAYDRYDTRRGREGSRDSDYGGRGGGGGGRDGDRGFFERAGDGIASWFGDDDRDDGRRERGGGHERGGWGSRDDHYDQQRYGGREAGGYRPMTGDYGRSERERGGGYGQSQMPWGRDDYRGTSYAGSGGGQGRPTDPHYHEWRQRQLDELDRDYQEYHRERQQLFENDFGSWRQTRQQKRQTLAQTREHMEVVGSDGQPVGKVDCISGDRIILTKSDAPDGRHHSIPCTMIDRIEGERVTLDCTAEQAQAKCYEEDGDRALFEREGQGQGGPHMLDRSFSGTYR